MNCDPNALMEAAKCFKCIPRKSQREVLIYLFCQLVNSETPEIEAGKVNLATKPNLDTYIAVVTATRAAVKIEMAGKPILTGIVDDGP